MTIDPDLLAILVCPETHQKVHLIDEGKLASLNNKINQGQVMSRNGQLISEELTEGLVREDGQYLYPIRHNIPVMLIDEAIPLQKNETS